MKAPKVLFNVRTKPTQEAIMEVNKYILKDDENPFIIWSQINSTLKAKYEDLVGTFMVNTEEENESPMYVAKRTIIKTDHQYKFNATLPIKDLNQFIGLSYPEQYQTSNIEIERDNEPVFVAQFLHEASFKGSRNFLNNLRFNIERPAGGLLVKINKR